MSDRRLRPRRWGEKSHPSQHSWSLPCKVWDAYLALTAACLEAEDRATDPKEAALNPLESELHGAGAFVSFVYHNMPCALKST